MDGPPGPADGEIGRSVLGRLRRALGLDGVWEVIMTVLRAGELLVCFVPVAAAYPAVWFGPRDPERGGETAGALWWYRLLRAQMSRAGPTFVKLAQWAASRTDLFSAQLCLELGRLHDSNRPHAASESRAAVARALGVGSVDEAFEAFDDAPLGAGAVAQVHRGRLAAGYVEALLARARAGPAQERLRALLENPDVAVKVLHPGVGRKIRRDLRAMRWCARALSLLPGMRWLSLPEEVDVFSAMMCAQLDLRIEGRNAEQFAANFAARRGVTFPRVRLALDSPHVLVESFCDGVPLRALLDSARPTPFDRDLGARGLDAFLHMLIYDNFVHADLHPGNILVAFSPPFVGSQLDRFVEDFYDMSPFTRTRRLRESRLPTAAQAHAHVRRILARHDAGATTAAQRDAELHAYADRLYCSGFTASLVFLDCGLVTSLDRASQRNFIDLFEAVCTFDGERAGRLMVERCQTPALVVAPDVFALRIQDIILRVRRVSLQLSKLTFGEVFEPVMRAVRIHHVRLAADFTNIIMAMFVLEGIGRRLDPDSDVLRAALPILRRWLRYDSPHESRSTWHLLKVWLYIELREYIDRIRSWGHDDAAFFGPFSPYIDPY
ncbi:hypothetical protein H4R18_004632 [Coemansia javaensis]|uniref:ABC1 atypical kinase-like domain-containing protein n=1 Tax=Coemansia javaensis TaxID=2761396 RepID=A0A9W8HA76_9FUNG|nr:hypothetical protein H4R18_004632 [Coemansia javaensis]